MEFISISARMPTTAALFWLYISLHVNRSEPTFIMPQNVTVPALIAFGDSILDQGNNNYFPTLIRANFPPYGMNFLGEKATGRFSNAKTPTDLIAEKIKVKEYVPAYLNPFIQDQDLITGVSFASGATGLDPLTSKINSAIPMMDQLQLFSNYIGKLHELVGKVETSNILNNSLFLVATGSDDFVDNYFTYPIRKVQYDIPSYSNYLISKALTFVKGIYAKLDLLFDTNIGLHKLGARRVVVFGLPAIGCMPTSRTLNGGKYRSCASIYNKAAKFYNKKLSSELCSLRSRNPPVKVVFADIYSPMLDIIKNPQRYGFGIVDRGCCGTGQVEVSWMCNAFSRTCSNISNFFFWDSFHPTEKAYRIIVDNLLERYVNDVLSL